MMRVTGFLAGVALTVAAFVLVLNSGDPAAEEPAAVVEASAQQADVVPAGHEPDQAFAPDPEPGMVTAGPQSGSVEAAGAGIAETSSQASAVMLTQTDVEPAEHESVEAVQPDHASVATDAEPQQRVEQYAPGQNDHLDGQARAGTETETEAEDSSRADPLQTHTHLFWSPFRSAWAAQGFAARLSASTQVPVEVVNAGPGNYRVGFHYQDESERLAHIERIETITGLELE